MLKNIIITSIYMHIGFIVGMLFLAFVYFIFFGSPVELFIYMAKCVYCLCWIVLIIISVSETNPHTTMNK